ncbi:MAG: SAM-dependent methyltransferase [Acidimicrobiales bacterium]
MPSGADAHAGLLSEIERAGGALRFDRFVELALYGDHGFYTGAGRAGRRGDFLTSPEVGPLFGTVLARWIDAEFERLGRPDGFQVIEVGAGPGTLARSVLAEWRAAGRPGHPYTAVERSPAQRATHPDGVTSSDEMPGGDLVGVVLANELLDNLPFRLLVFDGGWREAYVTASQGRFLEVLAPLEEAPAWLPTHAPHGARVPWQQAAHDWVADTRARLRAGRVLCIDYVTPTTAELAAMPWREWLRTYRGHERGGHYLNQPGEQDVTTQVALDQLPPPDAVRTQAQFLQRWGIDELVDEGRTAWAAAAAAPTVAAMKMRSRVREAESLLDPAGLGAFLALEWAPHSPG